MNDLGSPICETPWPTYDEAKMIDKLAKIAVQINGKLRGTMEIPMDTDKDELIRLAKGKSESGIRKQRNNKRDSRA